MLNSAQTAALEEARAIYNGLFAQHGVVGTITRAIGRTTQFGLEAGLFINDAGPEAFLTAGQDALQAGRAAFNASIFDARQVGRDMRLGLVLLPAQLEASADALAKKATEEAAAKKAEEDAAAKKAEEDAAAKKAEEDAAAKKAAAKKAAAKKATGKRSHSPQQGTRYPKKRRTKRSY
jgi:hypothetical protein